MATKAGKESVEGSVIKASEHHGNWGAGGRLASNHTLLHVSCLEEKASAKFIYLCCKNPYYRILKTPILQ